VIVLLIFLVLALFLAGIASAYCLCTSIQMKMRGWAVIWVAMLLLVAYCLVTCPLWYHAK
jgi:hypothetical protein